MTTLIGIGIMAFPLAIGAVLLLVWRVHRRQARAVATVPAGWLPAVGMVVDEISQYVRSPGAASFEQSTVFVRTPIVRFVGVDGRDRTFRSDIRGTFMPRRGSTVTVYYDPSDPARAKLGPEAIPRVNRRMAGAMGALMCVLFVPFAALFGFIGAIVLAG